MRTVVLDTNVLLSDPEAIFAFESAAVVLPKTVLGELDKVKTSRADPDLRYRGRKISRNLFELSEEGALSEGVDLPDGGRLQVVPLDPDLQMPEGLSGRNADDRILAVAYQLREEGEEDVTLVTNDLNMLLKAQTLGISVVRHVDGIESSFGRRYIVRPFQRYKIPLGILALSLAVFAAIVVLTLATQPGDGAGASVPSEFRSVLSEQQETILDLLLRLEENPTDTSALLDLGNEYYNFSEHSGSQPIADLARRYYTQYLAIEPENDDVRTDLAITYFVLGDTDRAIQEVSIALQSQPDHVNANYNLGIFYWRGRGDLARAAAQFRRAIELTENSGDSASQQVFSLAKGSLAAVEEEAETAGRPLEEPEGA